ncbi:MAG: hypothetical protein IH626_02375 [Rhodospirillales bacterium]|nr:hypothetical protein [Rhodospirillales bacterium]
MAGISAEQLVLEIGKSSELVAAFQMVAEAEMDGEPKFSPQVCRDLAKAIACRTYAKAVLELCHLVRLADTVAGGAGYEIFFWGAGLARAAGFRAQVLDAARRRGGRIPGLVVGDSGVTVSYPDGSFAVTYGRMPFLSALLEFLITTVGYADADALLRGTLRQGLTLKTISQMANELSRLVYDYLKDHLPTAQNQRKFRRLIDFVAGQAGEDFGPMNIDDAAIFEFWCQESAAMPVEGVDFKTFPAVFKAFVRLRQTLACAADYMAIENARVIGFDREAGEVDPDSILGMIETVDDYRSPLAALEEAPADAIKFLNRREVLALTLLFECGEAAFALPLSLLRCEVFGKGQGQLTQALRRRVGADELRMLIAACAPGTYLERNQDFRDIAVHLRRVLLACLHALARNRDRQAINLVMTLGPDMDFSPLGNLLNVGSAGDDGGGGGNVTVLRTATLSDRFLAAIEDDQRVGPEIARLMGEARRAFRGLSRQGFDDLSLKDGQIAKGYAAGAPILVEVGARLSAFLDLLGRLGLPYGNWDRQYAADKIAFSKQFERLYGGLL